MTDYSRQIERIRNAQSLDEIRTVANMFSAQAQGEGAVLYSGKVGDVRSEVIAKELAHKTGFAIINDTPRAQFLSSKPVHDAIADSVRRLAEEQGMPANQAKQAGWDFLYGNDKAPPESAFSVQKSLWGKASAEFAGSARGDVVVVASAANAERVLAQVEVPAVLHVNQAATLAGRPLSSWQELSAQGGIRAVLPEAQAPFIDAARKGIFALPDNPAGEVTQVAVSREMATTLHLDGAKFVSAQALSDAGFVTAPLMPAAAPIVPEPIAASEAVSRGLSPTVARGVSFVAAAAVVYDATTTASRTSDLLHQGNIVGAQSDVLHFGGRNLGALGGAMLGAEVLGTAGAETGPLDLVIGGVGAVGGAIAGDKLADAYDRHRIYNQPDAQGVTWNYDPTQPQQGWSRDIPPLPDTPHGQHFTAPPALAEQLTYQANNTAVELALGHPATPCDPYTQPAGTNDTPSKLSAPWTRDTQTRQWTRHVTDQVLEHGLAATHDEVASAQRAAQLDAAAQQTIAANLAQSPRGMAARYQAVYEQRGWQQYGPIPDAVTSALNTPAHTLEASDGHTYAHTRSGQWQTPGTLWGTNVAQGHVRAELDATERAAASAASHVAPQLASDDPRHPDNPHHGLYEQLQTRVPDASEKRLLQFTAACHAKGIGERNLGEIVFDTQGGHMVFHPSFVGPSAIVNVKEPSPQPAQSIRQIQHCDQLQAQMMGRMHAQNAQLEPQQPQGPVR